MKRLVCSYPYGGSVPLNLARLHASVAHYCPRQDAYQVKVMCASGYEEAAQLVRSITEETHKKTEVTFLMMISLGYVFTTCS